MSREDSQEPEVKMSFIEHLEELRKRIIRSLVAIFAGMIVCWFFREQILEFMFAPLYTAWSQVDGLPAIENLLNFSSLIEPFVAELKLSALGGVFLGAPVVLYQLWKFIAPGLYPKEKKLAGPFVVVSSLLFVGGSLMAYAIVFPIGFRFFLDFAAGRDMTTVETEIEIPKIQGPLEPRGQATPPAAARIDTDTATPSSDSRGATTNLDLSDTDTQTDRDTGTLSTTPSQTDTASEQDTDAPNTSARSTRDSDSDSATIPGKETAALEDSASPVQKSTDDAPARPQQVAVPPVGEKAPTPQPKPPAKRPAAKGDEGSWYDFLFANLFKDDCAELEAAPGAESKTLVLTLTWNQVSCGKAPPIEKVLIDEERVEARFTPAQAPPGRSAFQGVVPAPSSSGKHRVEVFYPTNPHAKKLSPVLMISDYLSFAIRILLAFGLIFELPILISFLSFAGIVNYKQLIRFSRWFMVLSVIVAAMLTPPDVVTQLMLAAPLMVLYFVSVLVAFFFGPKVE